MKNIFTTAQPIGVVMRDLAVAVSASVTVIGALGMLDADQVKTVTEQAPILFTALGTISTAGVMVWRALNKSMTDRGEEVAKESDAKVPKFEPVVIKTPGKGPDITVPPDPKA